MKPILFSLGPITIHSFGVMVALGIAAALFLMLRQARRESFLQREDVFDLVFVVVLAGFLGGRLLYVFQFRDWYAQHPLKIFAIWEGGLIFYGGVIGALVGYTFFAAKRKIPWLKGVDFLAPYIALTHAFGRLGCFLNGCCYGKVCTLPWAVRFPGHAQAVHPTQLYSAAFNAIIFLVLLRAYKRKPFDGFVFGLYFILYGIGRFVVEFYRADNPMWSVFTYNQWISIGMVLFGVVLLAVLSRKRRSVSSGEGR